MALSDWLLFRPPTAGDPKWLVRRWMAVVAFRILSLQTLAITAVVIYSAVAEKEVAGVIGSFASAIGPSATCLAAVVLKYMHDATKANVDEEG